MPKIYILAPCIGFFVSIGGAAGKYIEQEMMGGVSGAVFGMLVAFVIQKYLESGNMPEDTSSLK